jgi:hypothetical protein
VPVEQQLRRSEIFIAHDTTKRRSSVGATSDCEGGLDHRDALSNSAPNGADRVWAAVAIKISLLRS